MAAIEDNLLLLFVASVSLTALMLGGFILAGQIAFFEHLQRRVLWYSVGGAVVLLLAVSAIVRFRNVLLSVPGRGTQFILPACVQEPVVRHGLVEMPKHGRRMT